jgi:phospholipid/cholesterol/gamma-HCH transport system substrate-binding protein
VRNSTVIGRVAALAAVVIAVIAVAVIVLSGGSSYQVNAVFQNASQLVSGDQVQVAGNAVGSISNVRLTPDGLAEMTLSINDSQYNPLHEGTTATVRLTSLSGIANRYVELQLGPATNPKIPSGGTIQSQNTTSAVDLDELFDTLNAPTRKGLQNVIQGSASQYQGEAQKIQSALAYLNPAVDASSVLFSQLDHDTNKFTRFIVQTSNLVTTLAARSGALSALVQNLATTTEALASQRVALGSSLQQLPGFMRLANTTFVNLRTALTDLTPLVNVSKPVAPKLETFLQQLRPLAEQAVPTVQDLATTICSKSSGCTVGSPGANDLIQLTELQPALAAATVQSVFANGKTRPGAFPVSTTALNDSTPELAVARPYAPDLTGWFEGFSHPGQQDANGNTSRVASVGLAATGAPIPTAVTNLLNNLPKLPLAQQLTSFVQNLQALGITAYQGDRCPGSVERGALYYPETGFPCTPSEVPTGS